MTVQELAQRLARYTSSKTLSQMSVEDRLVLLDCINSSIFNWFSAAPENMRTTTVSHLIREPETGTFVATENSNELTGVTLNQYHLGASILINGDADIMNEIISVEGTPRVLNQLRFSGTASYTIYFDSIMITDYFVNRLVSNPRILDTGHELWRDEDGMKFIGAERRGNLWGAHNWWSSANTRSFGQPYRYVIENTGVSIGDEARIMLRVDPIPTEKLTIVFDASIDAPTFTLKDMDGTVRIPVPEPYILPHLLPMAIGDLAATPIWGDSNQNLAVNNAALAISKITASLPKNRGASNNRVRTRIGY